MRAYSWPVFAALRTAIANRAAARKLHRLDDRLLSDIGIPRSEIESALRNARQPPPP